MAVLILGFRQKSAPRDPWKTVSFLLYLAWKLSWDYDLDSIGCQDIVSSSPDHRKCRCLDLMGSYASADSRFCGLRLPKAGL